MHLVVIMRQPVPLTRTRVIGGFHRAALLDRRASLVQEAPARAPLAVAVGADDLMGEERRVGRAEFLASGAALLAIDAGYHVEIAVLVPNIEREQLAIAAQPGD